MQRNPDHPVIVDEAYVDFAGPGASCLPLVAKYENLMVVRTFSKSRSLAGARLGFCVAQPGLIADMNRVKFSYSPYNINSMSEAAGAAAMADEAYFQKTVAAICQTRAETTAGLRQRGFTVLDSATNFVFAAHPQHEAAALCGALRQQNVLVRHFTAPRIQNWLRVTIGTPGADAAVLRRAGCGDGVRGWKRRSLCGSRLRLAGYDYAAAGVYFVTICTKDRACMLGHIRPLPTPRENAPLPGAACSVGADARIGPQSAPPPPPVFVELTPWGQIVERHLQMWHGILLYTIMPDHIHFLLHIPASTRGRCKHRPLHRRVVPQRTACPNRSACSRARVTRAAGRPLFQRSFL